MVRLYLALLLAACGDDDPTSPDASTADHSSPDARSIPPPMLAPVAPPTAPRALVAAECALGLIEESDARGTRCVAPSPVACEGDQALYPTRSACAPISHACPVRMEFPPLRAGERALFVKAGAATGGTGTAEAPFATIGAALAVAESGMRVIVAAGRYEELLTLPDGVILEGACSAEVVIAGTTPTGFPATIVAAAHTVLRSLTIDAPRPAIYAPEGSQLELEDIVIARARIIGVMGAEGSSVVARGLAVRRVEPGDDGASRAIQMQGGTLDLERGDLVAIADRGIYIGASPGTSRIAQTRVTGTGTVELGIEIDGTRATLEEVIVTGASLVGVAIGVDGVLTMRDVAIASLHSPTGRRANAIQVGLRSQATLERVSVVDVSGVGLYGTGEVTATDLYLRGTEGIEVVDPGALTLSRAFLDRSSSVGVRLRGSGGATLSDLAIVGVDPDDSGMYGLALEIGDGMHVEVDRALLEASHTAGIALDGSTLEARDLHIEDVRSQPSDGLMGRGITLGPNAVATLTRTRVERCQDAGLVVFETGRLVATDIALIGNRGRTLDDRHGMAVATLDGSITLERVLIEDNRGAGIWAQGANGSVVVRDGEISGASSVRYEHSVGRGVGVDLGGRIDLHRVWLHGHEGAGVIAVGAASRVTGDDVAITDSRLADCDGECTGWGVGIAAYEGAHIELSRFQIARNPLCGVYAMASGLVSLREGLVRENLVAVCMDSAPDLGGLDDDVVYEDNEQQLDARSLPVPGTPFTLGTP